MGVPLQVGLFVISFFYRGTFRLRSRHTYRKKDATTIPNAKRTRHLYKTNTTSIQKHALKLVLRSGFNLQYTRWQDLSGFRNLTGLTGYKKDNFIECSTSSLCLILIQNNKNQ